MKVKKKALLWIIPAGVLLLPIVLWGAAALAAYVYSGIVLNGAKITEDPRRGVPGEILKREKELRAALDKTMYEGAGQFLPIAGSCTWQPGDERPVPAAGREQALKFAASPEGKAFFARNREYLDLCCRIAAEEPFEVEKAQTLLVGYRSAARICAAQAALAHWQGRKAEILPLLEPMEKLERTMLEHETAVIEALVRIAVGATRLDMAVSCGPEDPAYAATYRAMLSRFLAAPVQMPIEGRLQARELREIRGFGRGKWTYPREFGFRKRAAVYPFACFDVARHLRKTLELERKAPGWIRSGVVPKGGKPGSLEDAQRSALRKALLYRAHYGTALALKLYRCEKGTCPETLDALVPAFLPKLFRDPYTGAPLTYRRLPGNAFELSFPSAPHNRVRSKPGY